MISNKNLSGQKKRVIPSWEGSHIQSQPRHQLESMIFRLKPVSWGYGRTVPCLEDHPRTCKWLVTPIYKPLSPFERRTLLRGLTITMVINHLIGMILQVEDNFCHLNWWIFHLRWKFVKLVVVPRLPRRLRALHRQANLHGCAKRIRVGLNGPDNLGQLVELFAVYTLASHLGHSDSKRILKPPTTPKPPAAKPPFYFTLKGR